MNSKIYELFTRGFQSGHFTRIGGNDSLNLYIGKDDHARYCFEFRGHHTPSKVMGSDVISVSQTKSDDDICLRFALTDSDLLEHFCTFCQDLIPLQILMMIMLRIGPFALGMHLGKNYSS